MPNGVNGSCYCQADVICLIYLIGRCYCQEVDGIPLLLADVIANDVADVFTTRVYCNYFDRLMLLPSGRWNSHLLLDNKFSWADVIALWQMEWPLQGVRFPPGRCCSQGADG